jgi:hypothetical protein
MRFREATGSPWIPSMCVNVARSESAGNSDASTAAREATSGRRAHHT